MDCDSECSMDANMLVTDQDQTRTVLWIVIFSIYIYGQKLFLFCGKKAFLCVLLPGSYIQYFSISTVDSKLFLSRIAMGELGGYCVEIKLGRARGIIFLSQGGVILRN